MPTKQPPPRLLSHLNTFDRESKHLNAIIETPRGSRTKLDYDEAYGIFKLGKVMPKALFFLTISASSPPLWRPTAIRWMYCFF